MKKAVLLALLLLIPTNLFAQRLNETNTDVYDGNVKVGASASSSYQFKANMDGGGDVSVARYGLSVGTRLPVSEQTSLGIVVNYLREDFDFSGANAFPVQKPWGGINNIGLGTGLRYKLSEQWSISGGPMVHSAGEVRGKVRRFPHVRRHRADNVHGKQRPAHRAWGRGVLQAVGDADFPVPLYFLEDHGPAETRECIHPGRCRAYRP